MHRPKDVTHAFPHPSRNPGGYAIARLESTAAIPSWADGPGFVTITRTTDELSILCLADRVPADILSEGPWVCLKLLGPFDLSLSGIAVQVVKPVSDAGIGFLLIATFDTDYLLVKAANRAACITALREAGLVVLEMEAA